MMKAKNRGLHAAAAAPASPNAPCNDTVGTPGDAKKKELAGTEPAAAANSEKRENVFIQMANPQNAGSARGGCRARCAQRFVLWNRW